MERINNLWVPRIPLEVWDESNTGVWIKSSLSENFTREHLCAHCAQTSWLKCLKRAFLDLQGTAAPTSTPASALWASSAAQVRTPRLGPQPHEREEAALGAGGELRGNHMGSGEQWTRTPSTSLFFNKAHMAPSEELLTLTVNTVNTKLTCESSHLGCECSHSSYIFWGDLLMYSVVSPMSHE